ncbi:MAG: putative 5-keto-L-gluconate epimerase [Promethearchaeota archaeon]|nr:MAG: putative 5-keto-L-gluconate epimerase [Candidatus Lokiarchaeota archaeon]
MKLSIVSGLNESKSPVDEVSKKFEALCEFLKNLGFDGIELSLLEPEKINIFQIKEILNSYNFEISALGTGSTFIRFGYSLGHYDETLRQKAIERLERYMEFAVETNALVIIGLIRGRYSSQSSPKKERLNIISSLKRCADLAENKGVMLAFEPINSFEIDSYNTISSALDLLQEINSSHLKLLIDSYHTNLEEDPGFIWEDLEQISSEVIHIHLADTNRRAPGTGHFDFRAFLNTFKEAGYKNYASIETIMKPSFEDVARESIEFLKMILNR